MIPPKRFDIFPCVGCSEGLDAFRFLFKRVELCRILSELHHIIYHTAVNVMSSLCVDKTSVHELRPLSQNRTKKDEKSCVAFLLCDLPPV